MGSGSGKLRPSRAGPGWPDKALEGEVDFKTSIGTAVEGVAVLVPTPGKQEHFTDLNFDDRPRHDRSEIGITHSGDIPADIRRTTAFLELIRQNLPPQPAPEEIVEVRVGPDGVKVPLLMPVERFNLAIGAGDIDRTAQADRGGSVLRGEELVSQGSCSEAVRIVVGVDRLSPRSPKTSPWV